MPEVYLPRWQIRAAARCVRAGGIIAYPTEGVYGLGCDPLDFEAVARILELKKRPIGKGLILIAADLQSLMPYLLPLGRELMHRVTATWPGPVTWVLPARPEVPVWLRGDHRSIAVRVTAHPVAAALCVRCGGALVSTSANVGGKLPAHSALGVRCRFGERVDYIVNASLGDRNKPTEIRDGASGRLLRPA